MNDSDMMSCGICGRGYDETKNNLRLHVRLVINIYSRQLRLGAIKRSIKSDKEYKLNRGENEAGSVRVGAW